MKKVHIINLVYSVFLIIIGLLGFTLRYFEVGDFQFTSLIPLFFGVILISMTNGIKNQNKIISHLAVLLTAILFLMCVIMFIKNINGDTFLNRKTIIFLLISVASIIVIIAYISRFKAARKLKIE